MDKKTYIFTDGATSNNGRSNAVGGWGFIIVNELEKDFDYIEHKEYEVGVMFTTNNRMELMAMYQAMVAVAAGYCPTNDIITYSDSQYVVKGLLEWHYKWERVGWKDVKNDGIWKRLLGIYRQVSATHNIQIKWVRGHGKDDTVLTFWNNAVDQLATTGILKQK